MGSLRALRVRRPLSSHTCHASTSASSSVDAPLRKYVDTALQALQRRIILNRGCVHSVEANQLAANKPMEDQMTAAHCTPSDAWLFGVFDGHGGGTCAKQISVRLFDYVSAAVLSKHRTNANDDCESDPWHKISGCRRLYQTADPTIHRDAHVNRSDHGEQVSTFERRFRHSAGDDGTVREALQAAFVTLDDQLADQALSHTADELDLMSCVSGSTACVAHIRKKHVHIANVGDSMAVMGVLSEGGGWTARTLSHSHTVENAHEVDRIRAAHPVSEYDTVLRGGRLLGQLYPLRAFGDVMYKWSAAIQKSMGLRPPPRLLTPPYLTALPEVYYHRLTPSDRFIVLATDGLWDLLSPESVVRLVADHLVGKATLETYHPPENATVQHILTALQSRAAGVRRRPIDANAATHIIRHALGGGKPHSQYLRCAAQLQLPLGEARDYRDDISIQVIFLDPPP